MGLSLNCFLVLGALLFCIGLCGNLTKYTTTVKRVGTEKTLVGSSKKQSGKALKLSEGSKMERVVGSVMMVRRCVPLL